MRRPAELALQERMIALVRAFGLHKPDETPCGEPISVAEAHALMELSRAEPLVQKELASRLSLEKNTVSCLVGMLKKHGWVERIRSLKDGRAMEVRLILEGGRAARNTAERRRSRFKRLMEAIPGGERESVLEALTVLEEAMRDGG